MPQLCLPPPPFTSPPPHQVGGVKKILAPPGTQIFQNSQAPLGRASTQAPTQPNGQFLCTIRPSHTGAISSPELLLFVWGCSRMGRPSALQVAGGVLPIPPGGQDRSSFPSCTVPSASGSLPKVRPENNGLLKFTAGCANQPPPWVLSLAPPAGTLEQTSQAYVITKKSKAY